MAGCHLTMPALSDLTSLRSLVIEYPQLHVTPVLLLSV
jgi:hypothetical protein